MSVGSEVRIRRLHEALQALETALQATSTPAADPHLDIRPPLLSPPPSPRTAPATARSATCHRHTDHRHVTSCATLRMLQSLKGYQQKFLGAFLAAAEDGDAAEPAQSPGLQYDWHLGTRPQAQPLPALPALINPGWSNTTGVVR